MGLEDTPETEEKVLKIAKERYRGRWSTLSSTYKAYKTDAARLANLPEDLQPEEWEWMIEYFGTDSKFQVIYLYDHYLSTMCKDEMASLMLYLVSMNW